MPGASGLSGRAVCGGRRRVPALVHFVTREAGISKVSHGAPRASKVKLNGDC
jgi:hypothetical protein